MTGHWGPDTDVLIVGAGPAGLMLAGELGLAGVRTTVIERHAAPPGFCRGFNLNARSLDLLDLRGIAGRFLAEGPTVPATTFGGLNLPLDLSTMDSRHPYVLGIAQTRVEELLAERAGELGVPVLRGTRLTGLTQDATGVTAVVESAGRQGSAGDEQGDDRGEEGPGPDRLRARYLVGCDGGRSAVRKLAGIAFPGTGATRYTLLGDVCLADPSALPFGPTVTPTGSVFVIPRPGYVRVITGEPEPPADRDAPVTLPYLQAVVDRSLGRHVELTEPRWLTRFSDAARQAERYVSGRVLLAGDAAHIHPPAGAIGVNAALDDAVNLGWKLAGAVHGWAPEGLLDSYHAERHAAGERLLSDTRAQVLLGDGGCEPVRRLFADVLGVPSAVTYLAERVTGVGTRYPMPVPDSDKHDADNHDADDHDRASHRWLGRMTPDLSLTVEPGTGNRDAAHRDGSHRDGSHRDGANGDGANGGSAHTSVARLLQPGRPVFLDLAGRPDLRAVAAGWQPRLTVHTARCERYPEVTAMLLRPDGHVAWIAADPGRDGSDAGVSAPRQLAALRHALHTWLGAPITEPDTTDPHTTEPDTTNPDTAERAASPRT